MATVVTNTLAASALRGQGVVVSLSLTDAAKISSSLVGHSCTTSTGNIGRVAEVFFGGNAFIISPINLGARFDSTATPGQLALNEVITIN